MEGDGTLGGGEFGALVDESSVDANIDGRFFASHGHGIPFTEWVFLGVCDANPASAHLGVFTFGFEGFSDAPNVSCVVLLEL